MHRMKRLGSLAFSFLSMISLLICLGTVGLCIHSFFGAHQLEFKTYDADAQQPGVLATEWNEAILSLDFRQGTASPRPANLTPWSYSDGANHDTRWFWQDSGPAIPSLNVTANDVIWKSVWSVGFPIPILTVITAIFPLISVLKHRAARRRKNASRCPRCNLPEPTAVCPQCGNAPPGQKSESPYLRAKMPPRTKLSGDPDRRIY
jgi:hypothetical protein